jgi:hypothetical protein
MARFHGKSGSNEQNFAMQQASGWEQGAGSIRTIFYHVGARVARGGDASQPSRRVDGQARQAEDFFSSLLSPRCLFLRHDSVPSTWLDKALFRMFS